MPLSFFSRKKPVNVPANKSASNKEANKAAKKDATEKAVKARLKKHSTNAKYTAILNRLSAADPVLKKSRRLRKLKEKALFAKSNLSVKINDLQYHQKGTLKNVENAQDAYNTAYQNLENFANANYVESNNNSSPTKPSPFKKPFPERMKEKNNAYIASKGVNVGKMLNSSKDLPISQENQKLLNEVSNDELEQKIGELNNSNELEKEVNELSDSEDEDQVAQSTRRYPKRTPFYRGKRSLKSKKGRRKFTPKFFENYERSHPKHIGSVKNRSAELKPISSPTAITPNLIENYENSHLNHISDENMESYRQYMLKVRPHDIESVQNRSAELKPIPSPKASTAPRKVDNLKERARLQLAIKKYKEAKSKGPYLNEHEDMLVAWIHHLSKR